MFFLRWRYATKTVNVKKLAVEFIRSRRQGQYYESIVDILSTNHEYNEETSKSMIELAVNHNILRETKNQNKISYRINILTAPNVTLKDYVENCETQTEDHEQQEIKSSNTKILNDRMDIL